MTKEQDNTFKISIPIITNAELTEIDNNLDTFVSQFTKQIVHEKEIVIVQHIVQKQQEENTSLKAENQKKDKIINEMAKQLYIEGYCKEINCKKCNAENFADCIKQYFERKIENEKTSNSIF